MRLFFKFTIAKFSPKAETCWLDRNNLDGQVKNISIDLVKFEMPISQSLPQLDSEELRFPGEKNSKKVQAMEKKPKDNVLHRSSSFILLQHNTNSLT